MPQNKVESLSQSSAIWRINQVRHETGLSRSYIYQLAKLGLFPKPVNLVPGGTSVGWLSSEINAWLEERIAERDQEVEA